MGALRGSTLLVLGALVSATLSGVTPTSADAGAPSSAAVESSPDKVVVAPVPTGSARAIRNYWTAERMAAAVPVEKVLPNLTVSTSYDAASERSGTSGPIPPRRVPRTVGKLFFSDGGGDYVCSAAAIRTRKRDQVITAGHCVHTGPNVGLLQNPHFFRNWVFVPRYHRGRAPEGKWVARNAWAFNGWIENESFRHDQAIIAFKKRNGRKLVKAVGGNDVVWGKPQRRWGVTIWGWPAEPPFTGQTARRCDGRTVAFQGTADAAMHNCRMNGGASGGPWFLPRGRTKNTGQIWAVTSRRLLERPVLLAVPIPRAIRGMIRTANR
jgi:V8-like Glu-specific endopeptidase